MQRTGIAFRGFDEAGQGALEQATQFNAAQAISTLIDEPCPAGSGVKTLLATHAIPLWPQQMISEPDSRGIKPQCKHASDSPFYQGLGPPLSG